MSRYPLKVCEPDHCQRIGVALAVRVDNDDWYAVVSRTRYGLFYGL
jgi:hypothetical protein